ncbi:MAG: hypothetical protein ABSB89_06655 [Candidatus Bathyarchaeia archaeon]
MGDWDIVGVKSPSPSGVVFKKGGEVHFGWILNGRAVQDVWMTYDEHSKKAIPVGTTIRVYDPSIDAWHSTSISVLLRSVQTFVARQVGRDIVLEGVTKMAIQSAGSFQKSSPDLSGGTRRKHTTGAAPGF